MCKRVYLKAKEAEMEMQNVREAEGFCGKNEKLLISNMVKNAKRNSRVGDKLLMVIDPKQVHIPEWQRRIKLARAYDIGNNYNSYKWDEPKVLLLDGTLICVDGQHRIYGAFKAGKDEVVVEVMECTLEEAIDLFLSQSTDKAKKYLDNMDGVIADQLINPDSIYYGKEGHERFARECGYALNDFCEADRKTIVSSSYGKLYVKHCNLKPILDAKEWIGIMKSQIKQS